jgi:hypothetical protein
MDPHGQSTIALAIHSWKHTFHFSSRLQMPNSKPPQFSPAAAKLWDAFPTEFRSSILANVYCSQCGEVVTIIHFSGKVKNGALLLSGSCARCGHAVARFIEPVIQ